MSRYQIVYADPPWFYNNRRTDRPSRSTRFGYGAVGRYPVMTADEISALPVQEICAENCALFLWTTWPRMPTAIRVIGAWGFKYRTLGFIWIKLNHGRAKEAVVSTMTPVSYMEYLSFFGIGYYTKSNTEPCLLAIKGSMKPITNTISQLIYSPREKHSKKPGIVRDKIVGLFGDLPRVELFAREEVGGWDCWGLEVPNSVELEVEDGED